MGGTLSITQNDKFLSEYTTQDAISKYSRATAGCGISYLLNHDYQQIYSEALELLPAQVRKEGVRMLEFGCGAGMNLLHLISHLQKKAINVETAIGADFSPVMIETAKRETRHFLGEAAAQKIQFHIAKNETLLADLTAATGMELSTLKNSFHFVFAVNTIRYCHAANAEMDCAQDVFDLLVPGGVCVVIDMNKGFPLFRTEVKNRFRSKKREECYIPSLEEYVAPFVKTGFELIRRETFCWIPHSAGPGLRDLMKGLSPLLNTVAKSRAMRCLVVARKPQ